MFAPRGSVCLCVCACVCMCAHAHVRVCVHAHTHLCGSVHTYFFHGSVCPEVLRMLIFWWIDNVQLEAASLSQPGARGLAGVDKDALYPLGMQ